MVYEPGLEGSLRALRELVNRFQRFDRGADDDDDEDGDNELQWDMRPAIPLPHVRAAVQQHHHHHHHHHRHGLQDMFGMMANDAMRSTLTSRAIGCPTVLMRLTVPPFRGHRAPANARGEEDGTNPLLQRDGNSSGGNGRGDAYVGSTFVRGGRHTLYTRHGDTFFQDLVATVGANGRAIVDVNIGDAPQRGVDLATSPWERRQVLHALLDLDPARPWREQIRIPQWPDMPGTHRSHDPRSSSYSDEAQAVEFRPTATAARWQEEARMLFSGKHQEKATRIIPSLLRVLIPPAMEAKRMQEKADAEKRAAALEKAKEDEKKKADEKAEREKAEREERETREAEEARAREDAALAASLAGEGPAEATMEDVTPSQPSLPTSEGAQEATTTEPAATPRVTTTIRGRELDITSLGIDLTYLEELPEELREEVIMGQFAQQRSQAAEAGEQPSEISREFLEALPPDIQRELLRQEASERRHRQQQEQRRRSAQEGNAPPAQPEEMNNADFMAMLEPELRQQILADADENTLAALPEDAQAEARTLGERRLPRADQLARLGRFAEGDPRTRLLHRGQAEQAVRDAASRQRRPVIQMLDKAGIATLLRLMFVSLHHKAKSNLHSILSDVCKNTQNRAEVISILLSILQDGTADVAAVERSFAQLSLRAKHQSAQKTPTPLKRTVTGTIITPGAELSPLNIVQQCLGTLNALTLDNPRVPSFFLTEHETVTSQKAKPGKKGKGREVRAAKFPLNSLLTLLDRKIITENTGVMEALAALLSRVTHPLIILLRKAMREADDATKATEEASAAEQEDRPSTSGTDVQMAEAANVDVGANEGAAQAASSTAAAEGVSIEEKPAGADDAEAPKTDTGKKHREMVPPEVPEENIRLVVNIITARECPGKTFTETLDVIKNLSALPGARETFGKELVSQAQELSQAVLLDLEDLAKQINAAQTGTDLQGMALTNFSSAASMQHKLLRVLVALDHLFDPTQTPSISSKGSLATDPSLKEDILAGLYESATFDKLWGNLSQCLTAIRNRGNMINVAAVLLPIIESLMVVCRNSALKDSVDAVATQQATVGTPQPDARLDSLFFRFTEEHRKILNELIRNNPKLMNGNLAVLAKNSKVLEFDNKRSYFTRKVHVRPANDGRIAHPSLQLNVRRDQVFLDSFKSLYYKSGTEIKYGKLNIRFHGEEGVDAGGVSREWFAAMARQMFNPDYALFIPVASDKTTFHPNQFSAVNHEHLMFFKFIGRIIGKALYEGRVLDCHFSRAVYRRILGKSVSLKDMESLDLEYYKSLVWILENDITDVTFETFSIDVDKFGLVETVDLVPDGHNIAVTEENKQEYVRLVVEHRLVKSVEEQLEHFLAGFHDIIPPELIAIFNEQELELLISGLPEIDVDDWKNNTDYHNYQPTSPQIQWFWRAVRSFDKEERAKLLQFVTGTSKVPLNGFKELEGMNGFSKFNIHRDYSSKEKLPSSHTCFNQLDLPEYESYEHLRQQLYTAITAGSEYFGFA